MVMEGLRQIVGFAIGDEEYGCDIREVNEIIQLVPITRMPRTPAFVEGVINLRGRIIPIIDLAKRLTLATGQHGKETRIIVAQIGAASVGLIVDSVSEVINVPESAIEATPSGITVDAEFLRGVIKLENRLIILLELGRILNATEQEEAAGLQQSADG